jgi:lipopolysaccharide export system permease protein
MQFLWRYIDELVGKGLDTKTIGELMMYTSASLVPMALPLSILMSSLMTFGNLGEHYELSAIKASGISLQKILRPLVLVVLFMSFGAFFFANNVLPYSNLQMRSLLYDIRQQRPELQIKAGEFNNLIDGYSIRIDQKDPKTNALYGIKIYDHSSGKGNTTVTLADSGTMVVTANDKNLILTLYNGYSYNELFDSKKPQQKRSYPHRYDVFEQQRIVIELTDFGLKRTDQSLFKSHYSMLNLNQLTTMEDSIYKEIGFKQDQLYQSLLRSNYFKKKTTNINQTPEAGINRPSSAESRKIAELAAKTMIATATNTSSRKTNNPIKKEITDTLENSSVEDSAIIVLNNHYIKIDSLYNSLTIKERKKVTSAALSNARTAKNLISNSLQSLDFKTERLRNYEIEWHRKFTMAAACLLFLFIGAPLGAIIRKGGLGLPLILSVLFFILYYILSLIGEKLVRESILADYQGMWLTSEVFLITGAFITYKATTDSSILNMDTYTNFLKKLFGQRYNIVDKLSVKTDASTVVQAKTDNINLALSDLSSEVDTMMASIDNNLRCTDIMVSIFSIQNDSNLVIFERYYNNTFSAIINHQVFHNKTIRAKVYEFPALNNKEFQDSKIIQYLLVTLACIPPVTLLIVARKYIKLTMLRAKLKQIKQLIPELGNLLKISE